MSNTVTAVKPETLLVQLPSVPDWFERELARVATREGKPMFKLVDGQRERIRRCGKWRVKHLLQHDNVPAYVPVIHQVFRRLDTATDKYKIYQSLEQARGDSTPTLSSDIDFSNFVSTHGVGKACWIVEVYITPGEIGYESWEAARYAEMQVHGVYQKVDVLGEFPREGMYVYCFPVVDGEGRAISPNEGTLDECKKRWRAVQGDTASLEENIEEWNKRSEMFERNQVKRISDNFYQYHGVVAKRLHYGAISKPITKVYE